MKNSSFTFQLFILFFIFTLSACEKDSYKVKGSVINITGVTVKGATINLFTEGTTDVKYETASDPTGNYTFGSVVEGYYDLAVTADGYIRKKISIHLQNDYSHDFTLYGKAGITGNIIDAQTGLGIDSVELAFTTDTAVTEVANAQILFYTSKYGSFSIDSLPSGTFRLLIDYPGYILKKVDGLTFEEDSNYLGDFSLVKLPESGYRIILTWGKEPNDLDAHLTGPDESGDRFHVCYWNKTSADNTVQLELDDSWQYGPETILINQLRDGNYRYSVHNYSDQSGNGCLGIYDSPAKVEIYNSEVLIDQYNSPTCDSLSGNTWKVFEIQVTDGIPTFNPDNTYQLASDDADLGVFKRIK